MHKRLHFKNWLLICPVFMLLSVSFVVNAEAQIKRTRKPSKSVSSEKPSQDKSGEDKKLSERDEKIALLERQFFDLLNEARKKEKHSVLVWNDKLASVAKQHSKDMAEHGFFSREPHGEGKLQDLIVKAGLDKWSSIGRLIAMGKDEDDSLKETVDNWLTSKDRRNYIFETRWSETGIGIVITEDGMFYLTQEFLSK